MIFLLKLQSQTLFSFYSKNSILLSNNWFYYEFNSVYYTILGIGWPIKIYKKIYIRITNVARFSFSFFYFLPMVCSFDYFWCILNNFYDKVITSEKKKIDFTTKIFSFYHNWVFFVLEYIVVENVVKISKLVAKIYFCYDFNIYMVYICG